MFSTIIIVVPSPFPPIWPAGEAGCEIVSNGWGAQETKVVSRRGGRKRVYGVGDTRDHFTV